MDLSELQLSYSAYNKFIDPLNLTEEDIFYPKELTAEVYNYLGNRYLAARTLTRWQGAVNEVDAPYPKEGKQATVALDDQLMYQKDAYHLQNVEFVYLSTPNRVKQKLMESECKS